jgi:hypothetical protein
MWPSDSKPSAWKYWFSDSSPLASTPWSCQDMPAALPVPPPPAAEAHLATHFAHTALMAVTTVTPLRSDGKLLVQPKVQPDARVLLCSVVLEPVSGGAHSCSIIADHLHSTMSPPRQPLPRVGWVRRKVRDRLDPGQPTDDPSDACRSLTSTRASRPVLWMRFPQKRPRTSRAPDLRT